MKTQLIKSAIIGAVTLGASAAAYAAPVTDVQEYSNNTATEYFVDNDANKYSSPYYRGANQDWGWTHNAIAGTFSSIVLDISAYDVDFVSWSTAYQGERDLVQIFDGSSWVGFGFLDGANDMWDFTTIDLTSYAWAQGQVNAGLQVRLDIDQLNEGWYVTLGKATLTVDGGNQTCVPTPGVPCTPVTVPVPATLGLLGLGLIGLGAFRRRQQQA